MDILSGEWRKLIMVNYAVPPEILQKYVPHGTHLFAYGDKYLVTLAGFLFDEVKLKGVRIPFNHTFEEINLRFYVKRDDNEDKGVVFINEIVGKPFFGFAANLLAREHYIVYPTRHTYEDLGSDILISYRWKHKSWYTIETNVINNPRAIQLGTEEDFVLNNHWSFTKVTYKVTSPMFVVHPAWEVYPVNELNINVDFKQLFGKSFEILNGSTLHSVQVAEGSPIRMQKHKNF